MTPVCFMCGKLAGPNEHWIEDAHADKWFCSDCFEKFKNNKDYEEKTRKKMQ